MQNETVQSTVSYCIAGVGCYIAQILDNAASVADDITIVALCGVAIIRMLYDGTRLYRYFTKPEENNDE